MWEDPAYLAREHARLGAVLEALYEVPSAEAAARMTRLRVFLDETSVTYPVDPDPGSSFDTRTHPASVDGAAEAWERLLTRGLLPDAWQDAPRRRFGPAAERGPFDPPWPWVVAELPPGPHEVSVWSEGRRDPNERVRLSIPPHGRFDTRRRFVSARPNAPGPRPVVVSGTPYAPPRGLRAEAGVFYRAPGKRGFRYAPLSVGAGPAWLADVVVVAAAWQRLEECELVLRERLARHRYHRASEPLALVWRVDPRKFASPGRSAVHPNDRDLPSLRVEQSWPPTGGGYEPAEKIAPAQPGGELASPARAAFLEATADLGARYGCRVGREFEHAELSPFHTPDDWLLEMWITPNPFVWEHP